MSAPYIGKRLARRYLDDLAAADDLTTRADWSEKDARRAHGQRGSQGLRGAERENAGRRLRPFGRDDFWHVRRPLFRPKNNFYWLGCWALRAGMRRKTDDRPVRRRGRCANRM